MSYWPVAAVGLAAAKPATPADFYVVFGVFVALLVVLAVFVIRFAAKLSRERKRPQPGRRPGPPTSNGAAAAALPHDADNRRNDQRNADRGRPQSKDKAETAKRRTETKDKRPDA